MKQKSICVWRHGTTFKYLSQAPFIKEKTENSEGHFHFIEIKHVARGVKEIYF